MSGLRGFLKLLTVTPRNDNKWDSKEKTRGARSWLKGRRLKGREGRTPTTRLTHNQKKATYVWTMQLSPEPSRRIAMHERRQREEGRVRAGTRLVNPMH